MTVPVLEVRDLVTRYGVGAKVNAVDGVSLTLNRGETIGLVGESGCGKSSLGKTMVRLLRPASGRISIEGSEISQLGSAALLPFRRIIQMVFQDPAGSLNPRSSIATCLDRPQIVHGVRDAAQRRKRSLDILAKIGLPASALDKYPHEFSGGQKQRIGIARALVLDPKIIVFDEPVSALDLSIQAQIINLLIDLKRDFGLSFVFISHDLSVVRYISDRIYVMYMGRIVEEGDHQSIWKAPRHPYTRALLSASSGHRPGAARPQIIGEASREAGRGCRFAARCPLVAERCLAEMPPLRTISSSVAVACHFPVEHSGAPS